MQQWITFPAKVAAGILSVWFLLLPVTVHSLGFGNINMKSALNQPLHAEIELLSATPDEVKDLKVNLASREAFLRAGVDRSPLLTRIKFEVVKRQGKYYVILKTPTAIREPFLNFLLEMDWQSGRMLREYTVLLDPPGRVTAKQQMAAAPETTPPEAVSEPMPEPAPAPAAPAPEAVAIPEPASPFLDAPSAPAPAAVADAEPALFPDIPLDRAPQVPAKEAPMPAPEPAPEVMAAPEPVPVPEAAPAPEPVAAPEPLEAPMPVPDTAVKEEFADTGKPLEIPKPEDAFEDDGGLFPQIPLRAYSEAQLQKEAAEVAISEPGAPEPLGAPEPVEPAGAPEPYQPVGELDYGITKKGDTLWKIAEKLKPADQISIYQVMMALQQSNPQAFINGNIHRLKEGQVMRIDDPSLLTAMSKEQASQQYQVQTQSWEEYVTSVGGAVPRQAVVAGQDATEETAGGTPAGELTLATPQGDELAAGTGGSGVASSQDTDMLRQQVKSAMREAASERQKNAELSAKLNDLESELKRLENLVNIKDSDLAALQRKLDEFNAQRAIAGAEPAPAPMPEPAPTAMPEPEPAPAEMAQPEAAPAPVEEPAPAEEQVAEATPEATPEPVPAPAPATPAAPEPAPVAKAKDDGIMGMITGVFTSITGAVGGLGIDPMMLIIAVAVLFIIIVLLIIRKKRSSQFQESILTGGSGPDSVLEGDVTPSQGSSLMGGESSFLSDFAISGVSAIQAEDSEVDPLTEADVFMAYGRYEAAEERLQEAINQDAKRGELRVKLLELYSTTKNQQAFESAAEDFYAVLGSGANRDPLWQKVVAMGAEIAPGNPLFSGGSPAPAAAKADMSDTSGLHESDVMDIGLDTGVFNTQDFAAVEEPSADDGMDLDFSLGSNTAETEQPDTGGDLDFNLDLGAAEPATEAGSDTGELDFNLDLGGSDAAEEETGIDFSLGDTSDESTQTAIQGGGLDFESSSEPSMEFSLDMDAGDDPTATDIKLDMDSEEGGGLDMDFGADDLASDTSGASSVDLEMPSGGDEVGTKLDLARAYIDMGDPDGARSILDEVMDEGNADQKQEAQQLISQIG